MANKKPSSTKKSKTKVSKDLIYIIIIAVLVVALLVTLFAGDKLSVIFGSSPEKENTVDTDGKVYTSVLSGKANFSLPEEFDGKNCLEVHFINVDQGDAIAIMFPDGKKMLIDAGSGNSAAPKSDVKKRYFEYLSDNLNWAEGDTIDYLMVTHPDADHVNMMSEVLKKYDVDNIYYNDGYNAKSASATYKTFMENAQNEPDAKTYAVGKQVMCKQITGTDYSLDIYAPGYQTFATEAIDKDNRNIISMMCILSYGGRKVLFTGDAEEATEQWFKNTVSPQTIDIDVLKVGHHGSYSCTSTDFLDFINAEYAVVSCNVNGNSYHHPSPETMNRLFSYGIVTYRTDRHGSTVLYIAEDGKFGFLPENYADAENNSKHIDPLMITLSKND